MLLFLPSAGAAGLARAQLWERAVLERGGGGCQQPLRMDVKEEQQAGSIPTSPRCPAMRQRGISTRLSSLGSQASPSTDCTEKTACETRGA